MMLSNTEENHGSPDDANEYRKEEGFVDMQNDSFYPLFTDLQGEYWEQSWDESDNKMEDENKRQYKKEKKKKEEIVLESKVENEKGVKKEIEVTKISSDDDDEFYCDIGCPLRWEKYRKEESVSESKEDALELYCDIGCPMLV